MSTQTRIIDTMSAVARPDWQKLAIGHPALRHEVLQTLQTHANRPMALRVFLLEDDGLRWRTPHLNHIANFMPRKFFDLPTVSIKRKPSSNSRLRLNYAAAPVFPHCWATA